MPSPLGLHTLKDLKQHTDDAHEHAKTSQPCTWLKNRMLVCNIATCQVTALRCLTRQDTRKDGDPVDLSCQLLTKHIHTFALKGKHSQGQSKAH